MKVMVVCFAPFRDWIDKANDEFELEDRCTVLHLVDQLFVSEESRKRLFNEAGELDGYVSILKNGRSVKTLKGLGTELEDGDEVAILPWIAGG